MDLIQMKQIAKEQIDLSLGKVSLKNNVNQHRGKKMSKEKNTDGLVI